jgi:hypothetical protein
MGNIFSCNHFLIYLEKKKRLDEKKKEYVKRIRAISVQLKLN